MQKPEFVHDCDKCRFLGHHFGCDVYVCNEGGGDSLAPSIIARHGNEGQEYASGPVRIVMRGIWENGLVVSNLDGKEQEETWESLIARGGQPHYFLAWLTALSKDWAPKTINTNDNQRGGCQPAP